VIRLQKAIELDSFLLPAVLNSEAAAREWNVLHAVKRLLNDLNDHKIPLFTIESAREYIQTSPHQAFVGQEGEWQHHGQPQRLSQESLLSGQRTSMPPPMHTANTSGGGTVEGPESMRVIFGETIFGSKT
jgi:hypothetical protein